ncbi:Pr6Pr family membrane protein [Nesterenkonia ebinurensis]|uniref:Pr6Pr family membrane protein n=1 Tax=Nesterenkonia ebinurensis TaxID=2608252 RepID=UPI00123D1302|nr:Pr6Pr family membrane protein [Nesterenkonia ebinurensis]
MTTTQKKHPDWQHSPAARAAHAAVALLCAAGLVTSLYLGWTLDSAPPIGVAYAGGFSAGWEHMLNQPAYFTFLSALLVMVTSAMLAVRPEQTSTLFHAVRLASVVQIIITGLVFNLLLRSEGRLLGVWLFNDRVLHVILPVLVPLVWLVFGPHGRLNLRAVAGSAVIPLLWLAVTLIRGPGLDWYPYTILDVPGVGYTRVSAYVVAILLAFLGIACLLWLIDRALCRTRRSRTRI